MENENLIMGIVVGVLIVFLIGGFGMMGFGGYGMMGMMGSGYGIRSLCSNVGGIWCYWPSFSFIFNSLISILVIVILILIIVRLMNKSNGRKK